jgi:hypothetical protein
MGDLAGGQGLRDAGLDGGEDAALDARVAGYPVEPVRQRVSGSCPASRAGAAALRFGRRRRDAGRWARRRDALIRERLARARPSSGQDSGVRMRSAVVLPAPLRILCRLTSGNRQ